MARPEQMRQRVQNAERDWRSIRDPPGRSRGRGNAPVRISHSWSDIWFGLSVPLLGGGGEEELARATAEEEEADERDARCG